LRSSPEEIREIEVPKYAKIKNIASDEGNYALVVELEVDSVDFETIRRLIDNLKAEINKLNWGISCMVRG